MEKSLALIEVFERERKSRIEHFGLPDWLTFSCPGCNLLLDKSSVMSVEIQFEPMFLGDISFNFFCQKCCVAFTKHLKCNIKNISEIAGIFASEKCPATIIDRSALYDFSAHNLVKEIGKHNG